MKELELDTLLDIARRRPLATREQQRRELLLENDPEAREYWEEELALDHCLQTIPDASVSSNFTAQVLAQVPVESRVRSQHGLPFLPWRPRMVLAGLFLVVGLLSLRTYFLRDQAHIVDTAATLAEVSELPTLQLLDFESIQLLQPAAGDADIELLAALE